jgi:type I restriction enzyme M protein
MGGGFGHEARAGALYLRSTEMNNSVKTRPQRRITQAELDAFLEKAADLLRGGVDHSEFRGYVFALLFYKRINDVIIKKIYNKP